MTDIDQLLDHHWNKSTAELRAGIEAFQAEARATAEAEAIAVTLQAVFEAGFEIGEDDGDLYERLVTNAKRLLAAPTTEPVSAEHCDYAQMDWYCERAKGHTGPHRSPSLAAPPTEPTHSWCDHCDGDEDYGHLRTCIYYVGDL